MTRLEQQIAFLVEMDKLRTILRRTRIFDGSRYENDAEHSWYLAMMALVLAEHAAEPVNVTHVLKMVLIHDIVEIDAGDTFAYDEAGQTTKREREERAAERIFGLLPEAQAQEMRALWDEFEAAETAEARFANSLDRFGGVLPNYHTQGGGWRENNVPAEKVYARNRVIGDGSPALWDYTQTLLADAIEQGFLKK